MCDDVKSGEGNVPLFIYYYCFSFSAAVIIAFYWRKNEITRCTLGVGACAFIMSKAIASGLRVAGGIVKKKAEKAAQGFSGIGTYSCVRREEKGLD